MKSAAAEEWSEKASVRVVEETDCCVVGGGPAGLMLTLLLARLGVRVTLLGAHKDFDREFRGNTINPSAMETLERLGFVEKVLKLRHTKVRRFTVQAGERRETFTDFSRLKTPYPVRPDAPAGVLFGVSRCRSEALPQLPARDGRAG